LGWGGGYVDNKILNYIFSKGTEQKKFPLSFLCSYCLARELEPKPLEPESTLCLPSQENRLRSTTKFFQEEILNESRQMLWYLYSYLIHDLQGASGIVARFVTQM
jgi:hypothetical protein